MGCVSSTQKLNSVSPDSGVKIEPSVPLTTNNKVSAIHPDPGSSFGHSQDENGFIFRDQNVNSDNFLASVKLGNLQSVLSHLQNDTHSTLINAVGMWGNTPLLIACQYGHREIAEHLLGTPNVDVNHVNEKGATALLYACLLPDLIGIVHLLLNNSDAVISHVPSNIYNSYLDRSGQCTPLSVCLTNGNLEALQVLRSCDASVNHHRFKFSLSKGSVNSNVNMSKPGVSSPITDCNPLLVACAYGHKTIVQDLLTGDSDSAGLDVLTDAPSLSKSVHEMCLAVDSQGATVFHHSCQGNGSVANQESVVNLLCEWGVHDIPCATGVRCVDMQDVHGNTALHYACFRKNDILVNILLTEGHANPNIVNYFGNTPLHIGILKKSDACVSSLVNSTGSIQADPFLPNQKNLTAVDWATKCRQDSVIFRLLEKAVIRHRAAQVSVDLPGNWTPTAVAGAAAEGLSTVGGSIDARSPLDGTAIISNNQEEDEKADDCLRLVAVAAAGNPGTPLAIKSSGIPLGPNKSQVPPLSKPLNFQRSSFVTPVRQSYDGTNANTLQQQLVMLDDNTVTDIDNAHPEVWIIDSLDTPRIM